MHQAAKLQMLQVALHHLVRWKMCEDAKDLTLAFIYFDVFWKMRRRNTPSSSLTLGIGIGARGATPSVQ